MVSETFEEMDDDDELEAEADAETERRVMPANLHTQ